MTIDDARKLFDYIADIYHNGKLSGSEFTSLFNSQQYIYFDFLLGKIEQFQYGRPVPRVGIGMSNNITTRLSPFIKKADTISVLSGQVSKPANFGRIISMYAQNTNKHVEIVDHSKYLNLLNSSIITTPFCIEMSNHFEILNTIEPITMIYYPKTPDDVLWEPLSSGYTEEYDSAASIDPLWGDVDTIKIIGRMLKVHGISVSDQALVQYGQSIINAGE